MTSDRLALALAIVVLTTHTADAQVQVEAYVGQPFGVGRMTIAAMPADGRDVTDDGYRLTSADGRALYPAVELRMLRRAVGRFLGRSPRRASRRGLSVYFLFPGGEPLDLVLHTPESVRAGVRPQVDGSGHQRLLGQWWRHYTNQVRESARTGAYPPVVENYLTAMLSRRLGLPLPTRGPVFSNRDSLSDAVGLVLGTESIRAAMQRDALLSDTLSAEPASVPLPAPTRTRHIEFPNPANKASIEPIAQRVPEECFYVRFGAFSNYLWLKDLLDRWGGDIRNMASQRGVDYQMNERLEQQLVLKQSSLAKVLGPAVISDIAIIGFDAFVREGAAIGVLFEARNNLLLARDIQGQRAAVLEQVPDVQEETIEIAGHSVSFIHTPNGRIRSFYASHGDYHLVTTSRTLMRRFFEAAAGQRSLGGSAEFQHARTEAPLARRDTVFAYFSSAMMQQMTSPHYRVEMARRMQAAGDLELLRLAQLAAQAEGRPFRTLDDLIDAKLLPDRFGHRPDGSHPTSEQEQLVDSLRGAPGSFVPIADMEIQQITPSEAAAYERFADHHLQQWEAVGAMMLAVGRQPTERPGRERLTIEVSVAPFARQPYASLASWLGAPQTQQVRPAPGDAVHFDVVLGRTLALSSTPVPDYHVFGAMRDFRSPWAIRGGSVVPRGRPAEFLRGYLGAWPFSGLLSILTSSPNEPLPLEAQNFNVLPRRGLLQRQIHDFTVFSFNSDLLDSVAPQLKMVPAARPAQLRLHIADPTKLAVSSSLHAYGYSQARKTSQSVAQLMNQLAEQLHVPEEACREVAEELLGAKLSCALGGEYELVETAGGLKLWSSSALSAENRLGLQTVPEDYEFPILTWFRGLAADLALVGDTLSAHATVEMQTTQ